MTYNDIVRSMNARNNLLGNVSDDPLHGVVITDDMIGHAREADELGYVAQFVRKPKT